MANSGKRTTINRRHGKHELRADIVGDNPDAIDFELVEGVQVDGDGMYTLWPSVEDAQRYGHINAVPVPFEMAHLIGRALVQSSAVDARVRALLTQLCTFNQSTMDWETLSILKRLKRLRTELALISDRAPLGAKLLRETSERAAPLFKSRHNLAHGDLTFIPSVEGPFIVAAGKDGDEWFNEASLRDVALRLCRVWFELKAALDPADHTALRAPPEIRFLQGFQASNPLTPAKQPKRRRPPRSLRRSVRP